MRTPPVSLRIAPPLKQRIAARAALEHRTFSGEVKHLLHLALDNEHEQDDADDVGEDEVERLAAVYHEASSSRTRRSWRTSRRA